MRKANSTASRITAALLLVFTLASLVLVACNKEPEHVDYAAKVTFDPTSTETAKQEVTVKNHIDGDTTHFYVPTEISETGVLKARYLGINTPESTGQIQEYGKKAASFTKGKLEGATSIYIESDDTKWNLDSTGARYLVWVWYKPADSDTYRNLNIEIMQNGLAVQSNSAQNRYGESCVAAYNQAVKESLNVHSGERDPDFYYGDTINLTLNELRRNVTDYVGKTVAFEAVVVKNSGQDGVYVEAYDAETDMYNGMYVYYGATASVFVKDILKIGTHLRVAGKISEFNGTYQVSDVSFSAYRPSSKDLQKLDDEYHEASYKVIDPKHFTTGEIEVIENDEVVKYSFAELSLNSSIAFEGLRVVSAYTTNKQGSSSKGAISLYCEAADGTKITVRTGVLYDENDNLVTQDRFVGKTIDVKGIVDYYNPNSSDAEDGEVADGDFYYQIKALSLSDITIK
ncbi:MAG: thermonuclease family protein [Clostridia bacterium]|nr:thermonuclease family protein [Clostridia bacterium]